MKTLIIALNLTALSLVPFMFVGIVNISHDAPAVIAPGGTAEVTITINKGAISGPAILKLDFTDADGLLAEEIDAQGATFNFGDEVASFNWVGIASKDIVVVKYRIRASSDASGTKTISGKFSYLDEEERKSINIPSIIIEVNANAPVSSVVSKTPASSNSQNGSAISCVRTIEKSGNEFLVTLNLSKGNNKGFSRIKENIPPGFIAKESKNAGAVFKFVDNSARFLWTQIPADKENLTIEYKLVPSSSVSGQYAITGEFSSEFLVDDETSKIITIATSYFTVDGSAIASNQNNSSNKNDNNTKNPKSTNTNNTSTIASNSLANGDMNGIKYKVQILAGHKNVSVSSVKRNYNYDGNVTIENHEGWVKYATGNFNSYKEAKSNRNALNSYNFPGPFVVAYNNGSRITVQEALAISNQSWVQ